MKLKISLCFLINLLAISLFSQTDAKYDSDFEVGIVEHLGEKISDDIYLINEEDETVNLLDQIDKPTAIVFVYFKCPGICSPLLDGLTGLIDASDLDISEDYQVLTISFDPRETTALANQKKKNYQALIHNKNTDEGWRFFTADSLNIAKATKNVGFLYNKAGNEFTHAATVIIVSPNGSITRYLNGTYFLPYEFQLAIREANKEQTGPTIKKVLEYCYSYDPVGRTYVFNITAVTASVTIFMALIIFLLLIFFKPRRKAYKRVEN